MESPGSKSWGVCSVVSAQSRVSVEFYRADLGVGSGSHFCSEEQDLVSSASMSGKSSVLTMMNVNALSASSSGFTGRV